MYDSDTLAEIDYIPKNMVVQGGGIIGESVIDHVPFKQECERPNCEMTLFNEVLSKLDALTKKVIFFSSPGLEYANIFAKMGTKAHEVKIS